MDINQRQGFLTVNLLVDRITLGRLDGILVFGRGHPCNLFKLFGKILDGGVAQFPGSVCQTHFLIPNEISGHTDTHLTEIFHGAHTCLLPKDSLQMGTSDGEFFTDIFYLQMFRYVGRVIVGDTFE